MNRKSIAQEYYILVTDKYGMLPAMNREEAGAGLQRRHLWSFLQQE